MNYSVKTEVLKELVDDFTVSGRKASGIVRIENQDGVSTLFISTVNLKSVYDGTFFALLIKKGKIIYSLDLGKTPSSNSSALKEFVDIESGFTSCVFYLKNNIPITFLFSSSENYSIADCKKQVADFCLSRIKDEKEKEEKQIKKEEEKETENKYDDEAVATVDYYSLEKSIEEKISAISGLEKEENETESFYQKEKKELDELFDKFPKVESLEKTFPESTWVKINYSTEKFYVVGLVKENGKEKYICYGVPSDYSTEPPVELKGYCSFVPESLFEVKGKGYWMMFQDAITGECVHLNE